MATIDSIEVDTIHAIISDIESGDYDSETVKRALRVRGISQQHLFASARQARLTSFPDDRAEIRSVIEISNICKQRCNYCNIGCDETKKYVIPTADLVEIASFLYRERNRRVLH